MMNACAVWAPETMIIGAWLVVIMDLSTQLSRKKRKNRQRQKIRLVIGNWPQSTSQGLLCILFAPCSKKAKYSSSSTDSSSSNLDQRQNYVDKISLFGEVYQFDE
eukprot:830434_1